MTTRTPQDDNQHLLPITAEDLSEDTIRRVFDIQLLEIRNRTEELQLRNKELEHNSAHAQEILHAQERDRNAARVHIRKLRYGNLIFAALATVLVTALVTAAMVLDKDQLAADLLKITISIVAGAVGGYGFARSRRYNVDDDE